MSVEFYASMAGFKVPPKMGINAKQDQRKFSQGQRSSEIGKKSKELLVEANHRAKRPKNASSQEQAILRRDETTELISQETESSSALPATRSVETGATAHESNAEEQEEKVRV